MRRSGFLGCRTVRLLLLNTSNPQSRSVRGRSRSLASNFGAGAYIVRPGFVGKNSSGECCYILIGDCIMHRQASERLVLEAMLHGCTRQFGIIWYGHQQKTYLEVLCHFQDSFQCIEGEPATFPPGASQSAILWIQLLF